eukprot:2488222-Alexandrium_andersonii.AAC.1
MSVSDVQSLIGKKAPIAVRWPALARSEMSVTVSVCVCVRSHSRKDPRKRTRAASPCTDAR